MTPLTLSLKGEGILVWKPVQMVADCAPPLHNAPPPLRGRGG